MQTIDFSLLPALNALLSEGSVTGAARMMNRSTAAMSRKLGHIRDALGDPILVRAGRILVPTPRAIELKARLDDLMSEAQALFQPEEEAPFRTIQRTFTLRASDGFTGTFAARLSDIVQREAPGVTLRFAPEGDEDVDVLRNGQIDLDLGMIGEMGPEIKLQMLSKDRFVGVVRKEHPLAKGKVTAKRFAEYPHIGVSRRGRARGPIDDALDQLGLKRRVVLIVPNFYAAAFAIAASDLIGSLPERTADLASVGGTLDLHFFALPVSVEPVVLSQAWHPRFDRDRVHRLLRNSVREAVRLWR